MKEDAQGNTLKLKGLHVYYPLRVLKCYLYHHVEERIPFGKAVKAFNVKENDQFRMGSTYGAMHNYLHDISTFIHLLHAIRKTTRIKNGNRLTNLLIIR
jgi:hypothetical protein